MNNRIKSYMTVGLIACICLTGCGRPDAPVALESISSKDFAEDVTEETSEASQSGKEASGGAQDVSDDADGSVTVHVCGAVKKPGVYKLSGDSRVADALLAAGDFRPDADVDYWNQAALLEDGQQIYVPTEEEVENGTFATGDSPAAGGAAAEADDGRINLNTATVAELKTLPGIGDVKANAIISYREAKGSFSSVEEIKQVDGIKDGLYRQICDEIYVK